MRQAYVSGNDKIKAMVIVMIMHNPKFCNPALPLKITDFPFLVCLNQYDLLL